MKEKYLKPDAEINTFAPIDVVTTSGGEISGGNGGDGPIELPDIEL